MLTIQWREMKGLLRRARAYTQEALVEAWARHSVLLVLGMWDAQGFFEHCGYRLSAQLL